MRADADIAATYSDSHSTVAAMSGSGAKVADDTSSVTTTNIFCEREDTGCKFGTGIACRKF